MNVTSPETRMFVDTWAWKPHDRIFIRLDKTPERDGQTDRGRRTDSPWLL